MRHNVALLSLIALWAGLSPGCSRTVEVNPDGSPTLYLSEQGDPRSIDPHKAGDVVSSRMCGMTYECLYQYDYLARPAKLIPCLAVAEPEYDPATLTYTFTLRDDVYFQDDRCFHPDAAGKYFENEEDSQRAVKAPGRKLVAKDIEYSFKRLAALPDSGGFWVIEHKIEGLDAFKDAAVKLKKESWQADRAWFDYFDTPVSGLKVLDDRRIQVKLVEAYPQFLYAITLSYGAAVARESAEYYGDQLTRNPVGTGPYVLQDWWDQKELVWVRNPNFRDERFPASTDPGAAMWQPLADMRLPLCGRVVFKIYKEPQPEFLDFRDGGIAASGMDKDQFTQAMTPQSTLTPEFASQGIRLRSYEEPTIQYISFNMNDPVVGTDAGDKGLAIRRAFAHALNREDMIRRLLNGRGQPAGQLVPPGTNGYIEGYFMPSQVFDLEKARQALRDAGFTLQGRGDSWVCVDPATGRQVTITVLHRSTRDATKDFAVFLDNMGRRIGIKVENELMTFAEFLKRQDEGTGQIYAAGWVMDYPDAQNMLQLLYGPNKPPGINSASYANPEYDRLYKRLSLLEDSDPAQLEEKIGLIKQMNEILDREVPWVLMYFQKTYSLYHDWFLPPRWDPPNAFAYTYIKYYHVDTEKASTMVRKESPWLPGLILLALASSPVILMGIRVFKNQR